LVLGKFLPPHQGHAFLIHTAAQEVETLYIVVDGVFEEIIPVRQRAEWLKQLCPEATVLILPATLPQHPDEAPETFWQQWEEALKTLLPASIDVVFASEDYGVLLAEVLQARFQPVDPARQTVPISATAIRANPYRHWDFIPPVVRPYFCRKVCLFGPESVGKSTLAEQLARHFNTCFVPEFARTLIEENGGNITFEDIETIAIGHQEAIEAALPQANRLLFVDTDALTTQIWSEALFGRSPEMLEARIRETSFDLYLLLDVDVPWVSDVVRFRPENRQAFFNTCHQALERYHKRYVVIRGGWEVRFQQAVCEVEKLLTSWNPPY
jgi:NadR type nicotinamide-nucleotide adenylyltransferase